MKKLLPYVLNYLEIELLCYTYCYDKYIPEEYKIASIEQRYALLQGLFDTDGSIDDGDEHNSRFTLSYGTTSEQLAKDVQEIIYSLGYTCTVTRDNRARQVIASSKERFGKTYYHKHNCYEVHVNIPNEEKYKFFRANPEHCRRANKAKNFHKKRCYDRIPVESIEYLGYQEEMVCFLVDSVPTHNTVLSKAVARESGMNCVALNLNRIMDKYVGASERNLDKALDCAMAMQPTIIFIDEIDEALPKRHGAEQSALNSRINKRLLEFFSDSTHRGQVIILGATNYPEKIDPAIKRAGRFDKRIPMFAPDRFDRMRIIRIVMQRKGYEVSCIPNPDALISNPFVNLEKWIAEGNTPRNETFVGNMSQYYYQTVDDLGNTRTLYVDLPDILISVIGKDKIPLYKFYRCCEILLEGILDPRYSDDSTGTVESEEEYYRRIDQVIRSQSDIFGEDEKNLKRVTGYLKLNDHIYRPFHEQTEFMTGAELEVVASKCISIMRKWNTEHPERLENMLERKVILHEKDIPWKILYEACKKTATAVGGIKTMEDNALLDTSDIDFIPDAKYITTNTGKEISYMERLEELTNAAQSQGRGTGDNNSAALQRDR